MSSFGAMEGKSGSTLTVSTIISQLGQPASLTQLVYKDRNINEIQSLATFTQLQRLDLSNNSITSIESIIPCTTIDWLSLSNNRLHHINGIEALKQLKVLNIGGNTHIRDLSPVSQLPQLVALIANNNNITSIPSNLPISLNTLILSHNKISEWSVIGNFINLTKISLSHNKLPGIPPSLANCISLAELRLNHNNISVLPTTLLMNHRLKILDLAHNNLERFESIKLLQQLPYLRNISLIGNPLSNAIEYTKEVQTLLPLISILDARKLEPLNERYKQKQKINTPTGWSGSSGGPKKGGRYDVLQQTEGDEGNDMQRISHHKHGIPRKEVHSSTHRIKREEANVTNGNNVDQSKQKDEADQNDATSVQPSTSLSTSSSSKRDDKTSVSNLKSKKKKRIEANKPSPTPPAAQQPTIQRHPSTTATSPVQLSETASASTSAVDNTAMDVEEATRSTGDTDTHMKVDGVAEAKKKSSKKKTKNQKHSEMHDVNINSKSKTSDIKFATDRELADSAINPPTPSTGDVKPTSNEKVPKHMTGMVKVRIERDTSKQPTSFSIDALNAEASHTVGSGMSSAWD